MNKYVLYLICRLTVAMALQLRVSTWTRPRICRFVHSNNEHTPTINDLRRYVVASHFAYWNTNETNFAVHYQEVQQVFGQAVVHIPFYKDGTEQETDPTRQILAGYILQTPEETVVAFRGTKKRKWREWRNNLDGQPVLRHFTASIADQPEFSLWVHRGITKEYDRCRADFLRKIQQIVSMNGECHKKITFVGHSKGIISQLGALDYTLLNLTSQKPIQVITFGSYKIFAYLPGGDNPQDVFKQCGLYSLQVQLERDPVVYYPYLRSCYRHVFNARVYLKQPPKHLLEHCIEYYKHFLMDTPTVSYP